MRYLWLLFIIGCTTINYPDYTAVYHYANETIIENATPDEFCHTMWSDPEVKSGEYYNNGSMKWQN